MDLNLLQLFAEIVEAPNLSEAARRLGIARSSVSQRLKQLEREMGAQLLRRTTRRIDLTEAGRTVYDHAVRIRREADSARAAMDSHGRAPRGQVRLSIPTGLGRLVVAPLLLEFAGRYPDVVLQVSFTNRVADLVAGNIDVALKVTSEPSDEVVARELCPVEWRLCAAPAYLAARSPIRRGDDLARHPLMSPPPPGRDYTLRLVRQGRSRTLAFVPRLTSEDFLFLRDAARAGLGIALLPLYVAAPDIDGGALAAVLDDVRIEGPGERLYLLTTPNPYPAPAVRAVVSFLAGALRALPIHDPTPASVSTEASVC